MFVLATARTRRQSGHCSHFPFSFPLPRHLLPSCFDSLVPRLFERSDGLLLSKAIKQWSNTFDATTKSTAASVVLYHGKKLSLRLAREYSTIRDTDLILKLGRHVFCPPCAGKTGLRTTRHDQRRCPQCKNSLKNDNDVVSNLLNPPEDWKASVLAGLDPATIMECAQRALSFWTYQNAQEQ